MNAVGRVCRYEYAQHTARGSRFTVIQVEAHLLYSVEFICTLLFDSQDCHNDAVRGHIFLRILYEPVALNLESEPAVLNLLSASGPSEDIVKTQIAGPDPQSFRLRGSGVVSANEHVCGSAGSQVVVELPIHDRALSTTGLGTCSLFQPREISTY